MSNEQLKYNDLDLDKIEFLGYTGWMIVNTL